MRELRSFIVRYDGKFIRAYEESEADATIVELKAENERLKAQFSPLYEELKRVKDELDAANNQCENLINSATDIMLRQDKANDAKCDEVESLKATHSAEMVDAGMENRRTKRALWLAREQTAIEKHNRFALCHNHSTDLYLCINGASIPTEKSTTMRLSSEWAMIWKRVVAKCRAKAEEYR